MRIIGGSQRHRMIKLPTVRETRATRDAVREAIFSALGSLVTDKVVLDLFAGSGAFGLEALSRGARLSIMSDHNDRCIATINENLQTLKFENGIVWHLDYLKALKRIKTENLMVDIVFLDPPYLDNLCEPVIAMLFKDNLLTEHGIIITETQKPIMIDELMFSKVRYYKYGITRVTIMWR
ncbi:MAG TPA: 16S rRNA (guanine(966)-N(2))-methyltransferase RsmD [Firmicutes bacterium]|jgi:16S rRNA (guanine(966)-N(2))-methyltransferase RsmD|nr:16S rRNA (guanine(966)-N(2))-methyltransferase RsmD [Bacillota bacterium]